MYRISKVATQVFAVFLLSIFALSANAAEESREETLDSIKEQVEVLAEELEKLKLGPVAEPTYESYSGLGPAASKIYSSGKGLSIGGYGEIIYSNFMDSSKKDITDNFRLILYAGYRFNDWIVLNTEIEYEHVDEVSVEFSYLDFMLTPTFNIRAGLVLVPIGIINEFHEPTVYNGALRPEVERNIIPSTWRDIGLMAYGKLRGLSYKAAILNGMRTDRFSKSSWIRGGRFKGAKANADNFAAVLNLEYELSRGLKAGGTYYFGQVGEGLGATQVGVNEKDGEINLWEVHADYRYKGLALRGLFVRGTLSGNTALETAPPGGVGSEAEGWYVETAYDVLPLITSKYMDMSLTPFVRYEDYDTQKEVFSGSSDPTLARTITTLGLGFKPHPNIIVKADYQWRGTESDLPTGKGAGLDENKIDQFNLGIGFIF